MLFVWFDASGSNEGKHAMRHLALHAALISVISLFPISVMAQGGGGQGMNQFGSGAGGQSGLGGGLGSTSALGGAGGLGGNAGRNGAGGAANGLGATNGFGQTGTQAGANGQQQNGQNFLGRNTNTNQFLGRNLQGQGQGQGQRQLGNQGNNGNRRGNGNRNGNNQNNPNNMANSMNGGGAGGGQASQLPPVRPRQMVGFTYSKPQLDVVSGKLEVRMNKLKALSGVNLSVDPSGDLILRGNVPSYDDARRAENLASLEPGVKNIRNELTYPEPKPETAE